MRAIAAGYMSPWMKKLLWAVFLALTACILAYPTKLSLEPLTVWSPDIFPNLPLFGTLFYLWAALLLVMVFTPSSEGAAKWQRLALVVIAALVFRGFWGIHFPLGHQAYVHLISANLWQSLGHIVPHPATVYYDWPGLALNLSTISQITALDFASSAAILLLFLTVATGVITYFFFLYVLKSSFSSCLASLLIVIGTVGANVWLRPDRIVVVYVISFLIMLLKREAALSHAYVVVTLLLLIAAAVTHLYTSLHFFFFWLGLWIFTVLRRHKTEPWPSLIYLMLFLIVPISWIIYWGLATSGQYSGFVWVAQGMQTFLTDLSHIWDKLGGVFTLGQATVGESAPQWYSLTRLWWLASLYAAGGLLWLWSLRRIRGGLTGTEFRLAAAFFGLAMMYLFASLASPRGFGELSRIMPYAPFLTVSFLFLFLHRLKPWLKKTALLGLAFMLVIVSFPTFLANDLWTPGIVPSQNESSAGEWLQVQYGSGQGLNIFSPHPMTAVLVFHLVDAEYDSDHAEIRAEDTSETRFKEIDKLLERFQHSSQYGKRSLFVYTPRIAVVSRAVFGIPVDDPRWGGITSHLAEHNNMVYNNGPIQIFSGMR